MASNINPNNIDGAYPVAGQDNNSQGFRDNFTNIKLNFQYAEDEINDLQSKVLLKAPLEGQATTNNNLNNQVLYNAQIRDFSATKVNIGSSSGSVEINYAEGHYQTVTTSGDITLSFTSGSWPPSPQYGWVRVQIHVTNTDYRVYLPAEVNLGTNNLQGYGQNIYGQYIAFGAQGYYVFEFTTSNAGSTITIQDLSRNTDPILLPSSEDLGNGAAIDLGVTASYFTTIAGETATLAAGTNGQIKTLMMVGLGGSMVITVANPGWDGAGTITFNSVGQGCTLQYIQSYDPDTGNLIFEKWFCIGNNGAIFA